MKANAPDKIYACFGVFGLIQATEIRATSKDIEYTRTDAFVEKAVKWFRRIDYDDSIPPFETTEEFIEGFRKAMKL